MKRCIAFCLALGAALSLTACGGGDTEGGLLCEASGIRPDTVLLSVDGRDVSAQRYLYWLAYACDYIADYYDSGEGIQWGDTVSGQSLEDYAKDQALQNAALYATVETWAEDYGCTLTDEDRTAMDREWAARAAQYGGEEAYLAVLARMGLDRAEAEAISGTTISTSTCTTSTARRAASWPPRSMTWRPLPRSRATSPWTTSGSPPPPRTRRTRRPWPPAGPGRRRPFPS